MNDKINNDPIEIIKNNLQDSFSIAASAGCGKTHILISRVLSLLENGINLERLLLLTFTENTAREMRNRLTNEINRLPESDWKRNAINQLPQSSIQTINSFAFEVISSHYLDVSLYAEPSIIDEEAYSDLFNAEFSKQYDNWANSESFQLFFDLALCFNTDRISLQELAQKLDECLPLDSQTSKDSIQLNLEAIYLNIKKFDSKCRPVLNKINILYRDLDLEDVKQTALNRLLKFQNLAHESSSAKDIVTFFTTFSSNIEKISEAEWKIKNKSKFEIFEECIDFLRETYHKEYISIRDQFLDLSSKMLISFIQTFRVDRYMRGEITHNECLWFACRALKNESIRFDVWKRYTSILIDEFQDTDETQIEILEALSEQEQDVNIGRLFIVGDAKQAIYGFRGAKVNSYEEFVQKSDLRKIYLDKSFRTLDRVMEPINKISSQLLDHYREMSTVRANSPLNGDPNSNVRIIGQKLDASTREIRLTRAKDIANSLREYIDVEIEDRNGPRQSTFNDVALLLRDSTGVNELIKALKDQKIPYKVDSIDLIWELSFVKMTIAILKAISNPKDAISIVGALRSPLFQCDNDDLSNWVELNKANETNSSDFWNYLKAFEPSKELNVAKALITLKELHLRFENALPSEILTELHYKFSMVEQFEVTFDRNSENLSRFLISLAHNFEEKNKERRLHQFLKHIDSIKLTRRSPINFRSSRNNDAVKIMTIHKSKGLEFPIVYVVPSITDNKRTGRTVLINHNEQDFSLSPPLLYFRKDLAHSKMSEHMEQKSIQRVEEESRLLYVAMTRARDYLILCCHQKSTKNASYSDPKGGVALLNHAIEKSGIASKLDTLQISADHKFENINQTNVRPTIEIVDNSRLEKISHSITKNSIISPSAIDDELGNKLSVHQVAPAKLAISSIQSALIGTVVHRILNVIPFDSTSAEVLKISRKTARRYGIDEEAKQISKLVERAISNRVIRSSLKTFREVPVSGYLDGVLVEGFIDLLIETENGWIIVDYKTDEISKTITIESKIDEYTDQLNTYKRILEFEHGLKITGAALLFLKSQNSDLVYIK